MDEESEPADEDGVADEDCIADEEIDADDEIESEEENAFELLAGCTDEDEDDDAGCTGKVLAGHMGMFPCWST